MKTIQDIINEEYSEEQEFIAEEEFQRHLKDTTVYESVAEEGKALDAITLDEFHEMWVKRINELYDKLENANKNDNNRS